MLRTALLAVTGLSLLALPAHAAPPDHADLNRTVAQVRAATARYHDLEVALADGYELAPPGICVPMMGYHFVRGVAGWTHDELDPLAPEILVYAPHPNGELKLVAVEYASAEPAQLFGHDFDEPAPPGQGPDFHTLHAWVWKHNPAGMFAAHNPKVTGC